MPQFLKKLYFGFGYINLLHSVCAWGIPMMAGALSVFLGVVENLPMQAQLAYCVGTIAATDWIVTKIIDAVKNRKINRIRKLEDIYNEGWKLLGKEISLNGLLGYDQNNETEEEFEKKTKVWKDKAREYLHKYNIANNIIFEFYNLSQTEKEAFRMRQIAADKHFRALAKFHTIVIEMN